MGFENFNTQPDKNIEGESKFDPRLEDLWGEYSFPGHPPKKDSVAEKRLYDKCTEYSIYLDNPTHYTEVSSAKGSDSKRRQLHNEIAVMVVGQKRSGMESSYAQHIGEFAYEYARGVSLKDIQRFKTEE